MSSFYEFLHGRPASVANDEAEVKTPVSECTAEGGPEHCRFHSKVIENERVVSYVTKAENKGTSSKPKWVEVKKDAKGRPTKNDHSEWMKKGKHDKWYALKNPNEMSETPNFDSFADVPAFPNTTISSFDKGQLYLRSDKPRDDAGDGKPRYAWTRGGNAVSDEEALRLEAALKEKGFTAAINPDYTGIAVRPDLYNGDGQVTQFTNKSGETHNDYTDRHIEQAAIAKYRKVNKLLGVYGEIKERIFRDCYEGKEPAILAYFMMRTKIRAGSKKDPTGGRGATDLERGDLTLSDDGETFYASFNGKSKQWWHVTCKDKFLHDYIARRKDEISGPGANDESIFKASYGELRDYLKSISRDLVDSDDETFDPHDFRRVGATKVAMDFLDKELVGVDPVKDRKKWEDRIVKAVIAAAKHLNDQPQTVFDNYVAPNILFASSKDDMVKYFPFLKGVL